MAAANTDGDKETAAHSGGGWVFVLRNDGKAAVGSSEEIALPATWEALLAKAGRRLGIGGAAAAAEAKATRVFTLAGCELSDIGDVFSGDSLVVSSGEDFVFASSSSAQPAEAAAEFQERSELADFFDAADELQQTTSEEEAAETTVVCCVCGIRCELCDVRIVNTCRHVFCSACINRHIVCAVYEGAVERTASSTAAFGVRCPASGCEHVLDQSELRQCTDDLSVLEQLERVLMRRQLGTVAQMVWCPAGCGWGVERENGGGEHSSSQIHCQKCGYDFCADCLSAWHRDTICPLAAAPVAPVAPIAAPVAAAAAPAAAPGVASRRRGIEGFTLVLCPRCFQILDTSGEDSVFCHKCHFTVNRAESQTDTTRFALRMLEGLNIAEQLFASSKARPAAFHGAVVPDIAKIRKQQQMHRSTPQLAACIYCGVPATKPTHGRNLKCYRCGLTFQWERALEKTRNTTAMMRVLGQVPDVGARDHHHRIPPKHRMELLHRVYGNKP